MRHGRDLDGRRLALLAVGLALFVAAAGVWPPAAPAAENVVRIGAALPFTGIFAEGGRTLRNGFEFWRDTVNARGGVDVGGVKHKVEVKYYDDKSDPTTSARLTEKLIVEDKVHLIYGSWGSSVVFAATTVTEKYRIPMVQNAGAADSIYERGYKYVFTPMLVASRYLREPVEMLSKLNPRPKTLAILAKNELFSQTAAEGGRRWAQSMGFEVVFYDKFPVGAKDLSTPIQEIKRLNPDVVLLGTHTVDAILAVKQMKEAKLAPKAIVMTVGPLVKDFREALKQDAEFVLGPTQWTPTAPYTSPILGTVASYVEAFKVRYNYVLDYVEAQASACGELMQHALAKAGSLDPQKIRDALASLDVMTIAGPVNFDETGRNVKARGIVGQILSGEIVIVYPDSVAGGKLVYPFAGWKGN